MSLYLLFSDPHLADRAPSSCTDSYTDDLFDLIEQCAGIAMRHEVTAAVCAGDVFHLKAPSRTSHRLVQRTIRTLRTFPCPVFIVPGNHDITCEKLDSIHQTQPLGVLFESGAAICLEGWAVDDTGREHPLYGVPWLQGYGDYGAYDGDDPHQPIELNLAAALRDWRIWRKKPGGIRSGMCLVVAHAPLYPPGRELKYEYFPAERWAEAMGMEGYVFYGHVHEPHGTYGFYDAEGGITFCNHGALSRGSLHEYNLTRQVGCTLWDSETGKFEFVPLDAKPAEQVFRLAEKAQLADMQGRVDEFLASFAGETLETVSVESAIAHIRSLGLGRDAEELAAELLTEAAHAIVR